MSKILFLDIDGVANCRSTKQRFGVFIGIDPKMVAEIKRIVKATGCLIVLSSTWRLDGESRVHVRKKVCAYLDITGRDPSGFRGAEVKRWLENNGDLHRVSNYAILDDDSDFYPDQHLFQTSFQTGLTREIANKVIEHLGVR